MRNAILLALASSIWVAGCKSTNTSEVEANSTPQSSNNATPPSLEYVLITTSRGEASDNRTAKVATIKFASSGEQAISRCHQYYVNHSEMIVCRDHEFELVKESINDSHNENWARLRDAKNSQPYFLECQSTSNPATPTSTSSGTMNYFRCVPSARSPDNNILQFFQVIDGAQTFGDGYVDKFLLPTIWSQNPAQSWNKDWLPKVQAALPIGTYLGYKAGSLATITNPNEPPSCRTVVAQVGQNYNITIFGKDSSGSLTKVLATANLTENTVFGAAELRNHQQRVAASPHPASVILLNSESETTSKKYYSQMVRIVRFDDQPLHKEAGFTGVFLDSRYCQHLSPAIAPW